MLNLIFDFDGVLADTFEPLALFVSEKFRVSLARSVGRIVAASLKNNQSNWFGRKIQDYQSKKFLKWLENNQTLYSLNNSRFNLRINKSLLFTEVLEIVQELPQTKFIITNNYLKICQFILKNKLKLFTKIYTYDNHLSKTDRLNLLIKEYNLNLKNCLFFVDTVGDILEYQAILEPMQIFAVTWGYHSFCLLKMFIDEKQILSHPQDLKKSILDYENYLLESLESKS